MLGELLSFGSGILGNRFARDRQDDAQDFSAQQFATRYQTTTTDMKAAGLNPMLAYSQGGGNAPTSSAASASMPDVGMTHLASKMNSAQVANVEADTQNKAAQAKLIDAQAAQAWASAGQSSANVQKIDYEIDKIKAETANLPDEGRRLRHTIYMLVEQANLMFQQGATQIATREHLTTLIQKLKSETKLLDQQGETQIATREHLATMIEKLKSETKLHDLDISAIEKFDSLGKEYQQLRPIIELIRSLLLK